MQTSLFPQSDDQGASARVGTSFEQGFEDCERSAVAAARASMSVVAAAKQMQKAAQEGDIAKLRKAVEKLDSMIDAARQEVANARSAWSFSDAEEKEYLLNSYEQELCDQAEKSGLKLFPRDGRLIAFPSILRILPNELSVQVDRKRVSQIRPSRLVEVLLANQKRKPRFSAERFIESLFSAYKLVVPHGESGNVVKLAHIYQAFTLQPGSASEYGKSDFARDLYLVDRSGESTTRSGATLAFAASTGTRGGSDLFTFVTPEGQVETYYGIRFTEG